MKSENLDSHSSTPSEMKIVLFADLHLDASFGGCGLGPQTGRRLRQSLQRTLQNVIEVVRTSGADALLCGGDLYEHDRVLPETAAFLRYTFRQIDPVPVYISPGNHDWYGPQSIYRQMEWSPNVHIFTSNRPEAVSVSDGLTLWGAAQCAPGGTESFLSGFRVDRGGVNIGLFHASEMESLKDQGEDKQAHAPFKNEDIENSGFHHLFLGHYHQPREAPRWTYPGNPHPLSFGEEGLRGAVVASISEDGTVQREWRSVASLHFYDFEVDVTGCAAAQDIRERIKETMPDPLGIARVTLTGELPAELGMHPGSLSDVAYSMEGLLIRIGNLHPSLDLVTIAKEPTTRGQFVRDVLRSDIPADKRNWVLMTGLRALGGRRDLEALPNAFH